MQNLNLNETPEKKSFLKYFFTTNYGKFVAMFFCILITVALNISYPGNIITFCATVVFSGLIVALVIESLSDWKANVKNNN